MNSGSRRWEDRPRDARQEMISETSAFLSWALREGGRMPRIPRRRVDDGGFTAFMRMPGAWAAVTRWWDAALDQLS